MKARTAETKTNPQPRAQNPVRRRLWLITLYATLGLGACQGDGCSCADTTPYPDPAPIGGDILNGAAHLRIGQSGLDVIGRNIGALLNEFLDIDPVTGRATYDLADGVAGGTVGLAAGSSIGFDVDNLVANTTLTFLDPNTNGEAGLRFAMKDIDVFFDITFSTSANALGAAACRVRDDGITAAMTLPQLSFDIRFSLQPDGSISANLDTVDMDTTGLTDALATKLSVIPCDGSNPACDLPLCAQADASCAQVCELLDLFTQLGGFVGQLLQPMLDELGPAMAAGVSDSLLNTLEGTPVAVSTVVQLGDGNSPLGRATPLHILAAANTLDVRGTGPAHGLHFGIKAGFSAAEPARCVGDPSLLNALAPVFPEGGVLGAPPPLSGFIEVLQNTEVHTERYDIALRFSELSLQQALWASYVGGMLCMELGGDTPAEVGDSGLSLTAQTLQAFDASGTLAQLAPPESPLSIRIKPFRPPTIRLGTGKSSADPLMELRIDDLGIGLYLLVDDAQLQLSTLLVDISIGIDIERTGDNTVEGVLSNFAVSGITEIYNELAPGADIQGLVEAIVELGLGAAIADGLSFDLSLGDSAPDALGLPLNMALNIVRRDRNSDGDNFLSTYLSLCGPEEADDPSRPPCHPQGSDAAVAQLSLVQKMQNSGNLKLVVENAPTDPKQRSESKLLARVDRGLWQRATVQEADGGSYEALVHSARLIFPGEHEVELLELPSRSRTTVFVSTPEPAQRAPRMMNSKRTLVLAPESASSMPDTNWNTTGCTQTTPHHMFALYGMLAIMGFARRRRHKLQLT